MTLAVLCVYKYELGFHISLRRKLVCPRFLHQIPFHLRLKFQESLVKKAWPEWRINIPVLRISNIWNTSVDGNCSTVCVCIWKWRVCVLNGNEILAKKRPDHAHIISCLWPERHLESYLTPECAADSRCDSRQTLESGTVASFRRQA